MTEDTQEEALKQALLDYADTLMPKVGETWVYGNFYLPSSIVWKIEAVTEELVYVEFPLRMSYGLPWWLQQVVSGRLTRLGGAAPSGSGS